MPTAQPVKQRRKQGYHCLCALCTTKLLIYSYAFYSLAAFVIFTLFKPSLISNSHHQGQILNAVKSILCHHVVRRLHVRDRSSFSSFCHRRLLFSQLFLSARTEESLFLLSTFCRTTLLKKEKATLIWPAQDEVAILNLSSFLWVRWQAKICIENCSNIIM